MPDKEPIDAQSNYRDKGGLRIPSMPSQLPIDQQIRKIEGKMYPRSLDNAELRNNFAWYISLWYEDKTQGIFDGDETYSRPTE